MKHLIPAIILAMGLSNAAMAGSLGRYEQTKCIIEVKNKEGDEWKILEIWSWRFGAEVHVALLQKAKVHHDVRLRTETPPRQRIGTRVFFLEVKLNNDAGWQYLERWPTAPQAFARLRELENSGYYSAVRMQMRH